MKDSDGIILLTNAALFLSSLLHLNTVHVLFIGEILISTANKCNRFFIFFLIFRFYVSESYLKYGSIWCLH